MEKMHWIYILKCQNNCYYVGETKRLYRRFVEHYRGRGGINTFYNCPTEIVAIYKVPKIYSFILYNKDIINNLNIDNINLNLKYIEEIEYENCDHLYCENFITECLMIHNKLKWNNIRGGKYTKFNIEYKYPSENEVYLKQLPMCYCSLPCDIKYNQKDNYLFFRCAKKNFWESMKKEFNIKTEPCIFYKKYTLDELLKEKQNTLRELFKKSDWLKYVGFDNNSCIGNCNRVYGSYRRIYWAEKERNLCINCFIEQNSELSDLYTPKRVRLLF